MPTSPRPRARTRFTNLLPVAAALATDVLKFGTLCLLLLLGRQMIMATDRLPEIAGGDCRSYAALHPEFAASPRMRACLMLEQTRGP